MLCPICAEEFQTRLDMCPGCGCNLVPSSLEKEAAESEKRRIRFVELCRPPIYPLAMLIKQVLEQNGITAVIQGGHSLSVLPHLVFGGELRIMVDSEQFEYALDIYQAYFEGHEDTDTPLI
ncbi:MAG: DUF2007 domain-containing protein [Blastocatellia bacterium]|nr:DUF2007 domain-containing protein [Blastocatellia bacterium]